MRICEVEGCENKQLAKGYCIKHYTRFRKYNNPLFLKVKHIKREKHAMINTSEYQAWSNMKGRCYNKKHQSYKNYGARGITVCDRWRNSFVAFYADMGHKPFPKAQIDRIDNDGNYTPDNCRWVTSSVNIQNSKTAKLKKEEVIKIKSLIGKITQEQIAEKYKVDPSTISHIARNKTWREPVCQI